LELRFTPQTRLHRFTKELFYSIVENNETRKLLKIEAGCHGLELKLMEDTLGFGPVVVQSKLVKQLQLANLGDIGAHFHWDLSFCKQFFSIQPQQGYIAANEDVYFEVSFHPNVVDNDIRFN
jgi:hydrocephalus-inducing protein